MPSHFSNFTRSSKVRKQWQTIRWPLSLSFLHGNLRICQLFRTLAPCPLEITISAGSDWQLPIEPFLFPMSLTVAHLPQPLAPSCFYVVRCPLNFEHFWFSVAFVRNHLLNSRIIIDTVTFTTHNW